MTTTAAVICRGCNNPDDPVADGHSYHVGCCPHANVLPTMRGPNEDWHSPFCEDCDADLMWVPDEGGGSWDVR